MEFDFVSKIKKPEQTHKAGSSEQTGFPSPATHYLESSIDLNSVLTSNRDATFFIRVKGDGWQNFRISTHDVLIVDRSVKPMPGKLAVVVADGDFTIERIPKCSDPEDTRVLWGVITYIIHTA